ncbi:MAG: tetratricopeptide repeat protein, partial [Desulfobacteraceae bacterium]|nr:tetratricopeptide repeat protein [Desulfobacteraceae bacterium]
KSKSLKPDNEKVYVNLGAALTKLCKYEAALANFKKAIKLDPNYAQAYNNISETYKHLGRYDKALDSVNKAIELSPDMVAARWNRSMLLLLKRNFEDGWADYEWRWQRPQTPVRAIDAGQKWHGENFVGKTIFVYEEQGLGDTIQFMRYLQFLRRHGAIVIFEVVPPLVRLVQTFTGYNRLWVGFKNIDTRPSDRFDFHVPLLSLPGLLNTTLETIPADIPYLYADKHLAAIWKKRTENGDSFKVGIVWAGSPKHDDDHNRSVLLSCFKEISQINNVKFFSLQKEKYAKWTDIDPDDLFEKDFGEEISDFADTAAIIENLDLVISVDTSVVHLAGAMGKKVWTLLPFAPDWRWMIDREDSPWYPAMRLFRQTRPGDWKSVFSKVKKELESIVSTR